MAFSDLLTLLLFFFYLKGCQSSNTNQSWNRWAFDTLLLDAIGVLILKQCNFHFHTCIHRNFFGVQIAGCLLHSGTRCLSWVCCPYILLFCFVSFALYCLKLEKCATFVTFACVSAMRCFESSAMLPSINKTQTEIKICVSLCFKGKRRKRARGTKKKWLLHVAERKRPVAYVSECVSRKCGDETCLRVKRITKWKENVHAVQTFAVHSLQQKPQDRKQEIANRKNEPHYKMQT